MQSSTKQKPRPKTNATSDATNTDIRKRMQYVMQQSPTSKNKCNVRFYKYPIRKHKQLSKWQTSTSEKKNITLGMTNTKAEHKCHIWCGNYIVKSKSKVCVCGWGWGVGGLGLFFFGGGGLKRSLGADST